MKRINKRRYIAGAITFVVFGIFLLLLAANMDLMLSGQRGALTLNPVSCLLHILHSHKGLRLFLCFVVADALLIFWAIWGTSHLDYENDMYTVLPGFDVPRPAGHGEHGTQWWLEKKHYAESFDSVPLSTAQELPEELEEQYEIEREVIAGNLNVADVLDLSEDAAQSHPAQHPMGIDGLSGGGLLFGYTEDRKTAYYTKDDIHSIVIGATGSGKTRCLVLPSIGLTGLAGDNIIATDPKGEIYSYTRYFLEAQGYNVIAINFAEPQYSAHYNFLQPAIDLYNAGEEYKAQEAIRKMATMLISDSGAHERVWVDGSRSMLTLLTMIVTYENRSHPEYQNLANVKYFFTEMAEPMKEGVMPLSLYLNDLPPDHPIKISKGLAQISPAKMRGSFNAQSLAALDPFTDPLIHSMTADTDFDLEQTIKQKTAIFLILPDQDKTYHPLAALFIYQYYQILATYADRHGGRLPRKFQFFCDEFGNFVKIPEFDTLMTVSRSRGVRFHLFLQNFEQLNKLYGNEMAETIRSNAKAWVYLDAGNSDKTPESIGKHLGSYTIKSASHSSSTGGQSSASYNLIGRQLIYPNDLQEHFKRPYQLVMLSDCKPAAMYSPDLSQTPWNRIMGLGDPKYNIELRMLRDKDRREREIVTHYWTEVTTEYRKRASKQATKPPGFPPWGAGA